MTMAPPVPVALGLRLGLAGERRELLPDRVRVLGPAHPDTLITRNNIASWAGECGDAGRALRLFEELLPDQVPLHSGSAQVDEHVSHCGRGQQRNASDWIALAPIRPGARLIPDTSVGGWALAGGGRCHIRGLGGVFMPKRTFPALATCGEVRRVRGIR
jgi:hypothetical protein